MILIISRLHYAYFIIIIFFLIDAETHSSATLRNIELVNLPLDEDSGGWQISL